MTTKRFADQDPIASIPYIGLSAPETGKKGQREQKEEREFVLGDIAQKMMRAL